jgi:hypothetical protein
VDRTPIACGSASDRLRLNVRPDVIAGVSRSRIALWIAVRKLRSAVVDSLRSPVLHNRASLDPQIDPALRGPESPTISAAFGASPQIHTPYDLLRS